MLQKSWTTKQNLPSKLKSPKIRQELFSQTIDLSDFEKVLEKAEKKLLQKKTLPRVSDFCRLVNYQISKSIPANRVS